MPELPDVEGFRRYLACHARGESIAGVDVPDRAIIRNRTPGALRRSLDGRRFGEPGRHGKWLIAPLAAQRGRPGDEIEVLLHFGMTGGLAWADLSQDRNRHDRLIFVLRARRAPLQQHAPLRRRMAGARSA